MQIICLKQTSIGDVALSSYFSAYYFKRLPSAAKSGALPYTAGRTNTSDALRKMTSQMFTSGNGDRATAPN